MNDSSAAYSADAGRRTLVRLLRTFLRPYRKTLAVLVVLQFVQTLAALYLPTLNADIIDNGVVKGDTGYILRAGGVMLVVSALQVAGAVGAVFSGARVAMAAGRDIRGALFDRVQTFSSREVGQFGTPSLITRTSNDVQQVQTLMLMVVYLAVAAPIMGVGAFFMALNQSVPLSGLLLVVVPVLGIIVTVIVSRMRPLYKLVQARIDEVNRVLREQITGIRVVRAFVRDDAEQARFQRANSDLYDVSVAAGKIMALMFPSVMTVINIATVAVIWFGGQLVSDGGTGVGALFAFLNYLMQVLMAVMLTTLMFVMTPRAEVSAERIGEVLGTQTSVTLPTEPVTDLPKPGWLELSAVEFGYPGAEEPVLKDVGLLARPGEVTAVVGSTGSGKTTLLNLVPRLFDVTAGIVSVGGVDVRQLDPAALSRAVGYVPQRPYLFSGTVASNLRYGNPDATEEQMWHALEIAQAKDFVIQMPRQLDTPVAQDGTTLSGGQRQRLAIARALVHKPDIYLFDDSFSALDYATDAALRAALAAETAHATVVIVAQRVSTIRNADRIIVLEQGRVVGTGTHEELMATSETYREIVLSQLTEAEVTA